MATATTRPWTPADAGAVASLLAGIWGHDPAVLRLFAVHGAARDSPGAVSRTVVAEAGGALVGVGTAREYWLHPARWRVAVHVRASHRRRGVGSAILARLLGGIPPDDPRPLRAATRADDRVGRAFLHRLGFRPLMRTRLELLDPAGIEWERRRELGTAARAVAAAGYRIEAVSDLANDPARRRSLAALHAEVYRLAHGWNPPAPLSDDAADLFLGEDLLPGAMFVATAAETPVAVGSLRRAERLGEVDLGWVGAAAAHCARADDLVAALVGACLRQALAWGMPVRIEVDEADRPLWRLTDALLVAWEPDWLTLARPR